MCFGWIQEVLFLVEKVWVTVCLWVRDKLCFIFVFPSPLSAVGKVLLIRDTSKSLSDISRVPVIFYLKQALFLDRVGPHWRAQWKSIQAAASRRSTALVCVYTDRSCDSWFMFARWWAEEGNRCKLGCLTVASYSFVKGVLDTASSPVVWAYYAIIQAWPYLGRARSYVNRAYGQEGGLTPALMSVSIKGACTQLQWQK